jgi:hypothetical protein
VSTASLPGERSPERPGAPPLVLVGDCDGCGERIVAVRDRAGKPVQLDATADGKAVVDPAGPWWLLKFAGQWRVTQIEHGEDPPTSGAGRRHRGHQCHVRAEMAVEASFPAGAYDPPRSTSETSGPCAGSCGRYVPRRFGPAAETMCESCREVLARWRATPAAQRPPLLYPPMPEGRADTVRTGADRPPGRGHGLDGPACPEQATLMQHPPPGQRRRVAMCIRCGRGTSRRDGSDGEAWCGGDLPEPSV